VDLINIAMIAAIILTFSVAALNFAKAVLALAKAYRVIVGKQTTKRTRSARIKPRR
jgi:hypothetical protein